MKVFWKIHRYMPRRKLSIHYYNHSEDQSYLIRKPFLKKSIRPTFNTERSNWFVPVCTSIIARSTYFISSSPTFQQCKLRISNIILSKDSGKVNNWLIPGQCQKKNFPQKTYLSKYLMNTMGKLKSINGLISRKAFGSIEKNNFRTSPLSRLKSI